MKKLLYCFLLCISPIMGFSQDFKIPNYKQNADYIAQEENLLKVIDWLKNNPIDDAKRKEANSYVMTWVQGSPSVSIGLASYLLPLTDQNPEYLLLFIGGWIDYAIKNKEDYKVQEAQYAGISTVLNYYAQDKLTKGDDELDELLIVQEKGKLHKWIKKNTK